MEVKKIIETETGSVVTIEMTDEEHEALLGKAFNDMLKDMIERMENENNFSPPVSD